MLNKEEFIKNIAKELGFIACGISKAEKLHEMEPRLESWLKNGYHGNMQYMENHFDKRLDPSKLVPGAKSVISLLFNYYPTEKQNPDSLHIAKYAYGEDYHFVLKDKLKEFVHRIEEKIGKVEGRVFVDSAPVMERQWAAKSGLGWIGKHSLLINKKQGSFFFISELILDLELQEDYKVTDHCGTCTACIDACPTDAIVANKIIDGSKCISYLTIELKEEIPSSFKGKMENWVFGCDICQDVCPWNRFSSAHSVPEFTPNKKVMEMDKQEWTELTEEVFRDLFRKSALKRTKFQGITRNVQFLEQKPSN